MCAALLSSRSCPAWFVGGALLPLKPAQLVLSLKLAQCPHASHKAWLFFSCPAGPLSEQNIKDRYYGVNDPVSDWRL